MKNSLKIAASGAVLISMLGLGAVAANGSAKETPNDHPSRTSSPAAGTDHPECYDERKLHDPADFCYLTIGPWNSTKSSDEEVRSLMPIDRMLTAGKTTEEIQRYYPDYVPAAR
ncbi:hypothetical protein [Arthrobacter sp. UYCu712]|uniref:hypothetical protein n=1 Tax=Arthrobacter sp. UYCu712 TaxID=3156340 RepID=UPI0033974E56